MKQTLTSAALGVVLLAAIVAFALVPGSGAADDPPRPEPAPTAAADLAACREFDIGIAASDLDAALADLGIALGFEREGGDGGTGFHDWVDADLVTSALTEVAEMAGRVALTPGLDEEVYQPLREVVRLATSLERSAISGTMFEVDQVADERVALGEAVDAVEDACA